MGPTSSKGSAQLYNGRGEYSPSERANAAVRSATGNSQVVGEKGGSVNTGPKAQGGDSPKQSTGGTPPSLKQQAAARYSDPGGSSVNDEKA